MRQRRTPAPASRAPFVAEYVKRCTKAEPRQRPQEAVCLLRATQASRMRLSANSARLVRGGPAAIRYHTCCPPSVDVNDMNDTATGTTDFRRKIISPERLQWIIEAARGGEGQARPRFVQCHGCFDIVHPGHIRYLQYARTQGECLIVSITGDADIHKGELRPYIPQELRAENLAALEFVDYVVIDPNPTAARLLAQLRPDVYVKGEEYATSRDPRFLEEKQVVEASGGRVLFSSGQVVFSSTRLGEGMAPPRIEAERLRIVCRRHGIDLRAMSRLVESFRGRRVLICGDIRLDRYVLCDAGGVASESPIMSLSELDRRDYLGGAALLATQAAALGARPTLVTCLGDDPDSDKAAAALRQRGVRVLSAARRSAFPVRTRYLVDEHKMFRVDRGGPAPIDSVGQRRAAELLLAEAAGAESAILYDAGYGAITPALMQQVGPALRERVATLCAGTAEPQGGPPHFRDLDLLLVSERRLRSMLSDPSGGLSALAYRLLEQAQATRLLVTVGKRGVVTFDRPSHDRSSEAWRDRLLSEFLPALADRVIDRLGCSESMLATASLAVGAGATLMQTAYLCQLAASVQIQRLGCLPVSAEELHRELIGRPELSPIAHGSMPVAPVADGAPFAPVSYAHEHIPA